jgi:hypothetical protein
MLKTLATVLIAWSSLGMLHAAQKPVIQSPIVAEPYNLPSTLEGFIARSDAVILARVIRARDVSEPRRARTAYDMAVVQTIKEHKNVDQTTTVCRPIGTLDYPDKTVKVYQPHLPNFEVGTEYLLFLTWDERNGCFSLTFGPPGVALIDQGGRFRAVVDHVVLQSLSGLGRAQVLDRLASVPHK